MTSPLLSDADIAFCIADYLVNGSRRNLEHLTQDVVPEKYRVTPKGWLYRGEQRVLAVSPQKERLYTRGGFCSYTTSFGNAKDFAMGICGNDYTKPKGWQWRRQPPGTRYGVVYKWKPTLDQVVLSIGKFLRAASIDDATLKQFKYENEYLLNTGPCELKKEDIVWFTTKVVCD